MTTCPLPIHADPERTTGHDTKATVHGVLNLQAVTICRHCADNIDERLFDECETWQDAVESAREKAAKWRREDYSSNDVEGAAYFERLRGQAYEDDGRPTGAEL